MPVRIYEISKKLGLENKEVLAKAKELGIAGARVASSSLDKITAEYLEQQLILSNPQAAAAVAAPAATGPGAPESVVISPPPPVETEQATETISGTATAIMEPPEPPTEELTK